MLPEVALAILPKGDLVLCQLRDDIPGINFPGEWGLFGGHLDPGEQPEAALRRELLEEIELQFTESIHFGVYPDSNVIRHVFVVPLQRKIEELKLNEGWDMAFLSIHEIQKGHAYSSIAGMTRNLAEPMRKILWDFFKS